MLSFYVAAILKQGRHGQFLAGKSTLLNSDACKKITLGKLPLGSFVVGLDVVSGECVDIVGSVADKQLVLDLGKKVKE